MSLRPKIKTKRHFSDSGKIYYAYKVKEDNLTFYSKPSLYFHLFATRFMVPGLIIGCIVFIVLGIYYGRP